MSQIGTYLYYMLLFDSNHITLPFDITTVEPPCLTTSHKQPPIQNTKYFPSQILIVETSSKLAPTCKQPINLFANMPGGHIELI